MILRNVNIDEDENIFVTNQKINLSKITKSAIKQKLNTNIYIYI